MADDWLESIFRQLPEREPGRQTFRLGDEVRVRSGPFASFRVRVEGINQAKSLLKVKVEFFGREKPLKFGFHEVEPLPRT
ncbi:MAG TPA: KOW motif-containing protein [Pyrinomonadaceae bacterium]|nr:KOW motif-containing protein [Pyrinomonadaceae bacterium]